MEIGHDLGVDPELCRRVEVDDGAAPGPGVELVENVVCDFLVCLVDVKDIPSWSVDLGHVPFDAEKFHYAVAYLVHVLGLVANGRRFLSEIQEDLFKVADGSELQVWKCVTGNRK